MGLARAYAVALVGVMGHMVEVEAHVSSGLPAVIMVGLPDAALREARDRIRAAILNSGLEWPGNKITIGLSPASLPKRGSGFDLSIAVAILAASADAATPMEIPHRAVFVAELGWTGGCARCRECSRRSSPPPGKASTPWWWPARTARRPRWCLA